MMYFALYSFIAVIIVVFAQAACTHTKPNKYRIVKVYDCFQVESYVGFLPVWNIESEKMKTEKEAQEFLDTIVLQHSRQYATPVLVNEYKP